MATQKKAPAKKKAATRKAAPRTTARKSDEFSLRNSAEKAFNIYLGVLGTGYDRVQENIRNARKDNEKRMSGFEKRGARLRRELRKEIDEIEVPGFDNAVEGAKGQFNKLQDQLEDAIGNAREKLTPTRDAA